MSDEGLFEGSGSEYEPGSNEWEATDDRDHTVCFENTSFGRRINEDGIAPGIRLGFHRHIGIEVAILSQDDAEVSRIVEDMWLHLHPMHAYDLWIGLLRALADAEDAQVLNWEGYKWPMKPNEVIMAMQALAQTIYPDFDPNYEPPEDPHGGVHNDPDNS